MTMVRAVYNSTASPLSEQRVVEVEAGWYEEAVGLSSFYDLVGSVCAACSAALSQMEV